MRSIGININLQKEGVEVLARELIRWLEDKGLEVFLQPGQASVLGLEQEAYNLVEMSRDIECLLVCGGDGTILGSARMAARSGVPIIGINLGHLGFLTEIDLPGLWRDLEKIVGGEYEIEERMMIEARLLRDGKELGCSIGLNDATITKGALARLIALETLVDGEQVCVYNADGIIVSTPTGSTAYSLSAGGPVATPEMDLMIITPICPHTLWARPLVIQPDCVVEIRLLSGNSRVMLTIDGQHGLPMQKNDVVTVARSPYRVKFIRLNQRNFFKLLKQKLREGDGRFDS